MNIVIAINKKWVRYAYVMLLSLLTNNPERICVYVLHRELAVEDLKTFELLKVSFDVKFCFVYVPDSYIPSKEVLQAIPAWGIEAYFRLAIIDLLPADLERVLYLDSDIIVNSSLGEIYNCRMGGVLAACKEYISSPPFGDYRDEIFGEIIHNNIMSDRFQYFNSGVLLFDLQVLRPTISFSAYMEKAKALQYKINYPDQDLLNYFHHNEVMFLDYKKYNLYAKRAYTDLNMHYAEVKENAVIIHYNSGKPWDGGGLNYDLQQLWWDYAERTPFYEDFAKQMIRSLNCDDELYRYIIELLGENEQLFDILRKYEKIFESSGTNI